MNCDDDANKPLCGQLGIQGFPTLKIVRPKKGGGKPSVEDYQGQRTAAGIVEAVKSKINNYVKRVDDKNADDFLSSNKDAAKAILFSDKGTISSLMMGVAIDFLDVMAVAQVRDKQTKTVELFGIEKFPTLVLLPGNGAEAIVYDGEMKKDDIVKFLSQAGEPNQDPAPVKGKAEKKDKKSAPPKAKPSSSSAESEAETTTQQAPVIVETALPIPTINTKEKLIKECLTEKSSTCVLALVPSGGSEQATAALATLSELAFKHSQSKRHLFPFFEVSKDNEGAVSLANALDLSGEVEIIAVNARRGWWRRLEGSDFGHESIESWIDAIRLSEGVKKKLPEGLVAISVASAEPVSEETPAAEEKKPIEHEEL